MYVDADTINIRKSDFSVRVFLNRNARTYYYSDFSNYRGDLSFGGGNPADIVAAIDHCNIRNFDYVRPQNWLTTIRNCIIDTAWFCLPVVLCSTQKCSTSYVCDTRMYSSFINHTIFADTAISPIFGLLVNNRTSGNGHPCDTWFNMRTNPLFADSGRFTLSEVSPALEAASDGTNIGCYQGNSIGALPPLRRQWHSPQSVTIRSNRSSITLKFVHYRQANHVTVSVYTIQGKILKPLNITYDNDIITWNGVILPSGLYIISIKQDGISSNFPLCIRKAM
jgi:hypothetical protein